MGFLLAAVLLVMLSATQGPRMMELLLLLALWGLLMFFLGLFLRRK